jgi:hypothetical protein
LTKLQAAGEKAVAKGATALIASKQQCCSMLTYAVLSVEASIMQILLQAVL